MKARAVELPSEGCSSYHIHVSRHAFRRARERLHWNSNATQRMACRALARGLVPASSVDAIRHVLPGEVNPDGKACPFLYGEHVYIFSGNAIERSAVLLTIYRAPRALLRPMVHRSHLGPATQDLEPTEDLSRTLPVMALVLRAA